MEDIHGHTPVTGLSFPAPDAYAALSDAEKQTATLTEDLCQVGEHYFIRAQLLLPIKGQEQPFSWGVWVSQSEENFNYYREHFTENLEGRDTFGWLANAIPGYEFDEPLKARVQWRRQGERPVLHLENTEHPLAIDFHEGISQDKAAAFFDNPNVVRN